MADFDFSSLFSGALDWAKANPGLVGAGISALGTLSDPAQAATSTAQQAVSLPDYAAPYVGRYLNRAEGLSQEDYIPYGGPRVADFNADQQNAMQRARDLQPMNPMQTQGAGIVGQAATQLLQNAGQRWDQSQADRYMSPYQQSVTDIAKREAERDYQKQIPGMNAAAVRQGAFGGDRSAIVEAEAQRNYNQQLGDIQVRGLQSAFTNAQGQFNTDQGRQTGNLTAASGAGNTLAGIGQQGFQNQLAANQGVMGIGNQQQNLQQQGIDTDYQSFLEQRQHPYNQVDYMRAGIGGLPMTQNTTANTTTPAPSLTQQLIGNMTGGYMLGGKKP